MKFCMAGRVDAVEVFGARERDDEDVRGREAEFAVLGGWWGCFEGHFGSSSICRFLG